MNKRTDEHKRRQAAIDTILKTSDFMMRKHQLTTAAIADILSQLAIDYRATGDYRTSATERRILAEDHARRSRRADYIARVRAVMD